jgi:pimeloyl-ACP methyl ester carboxylesterase
MAQGKPTIVLVHGAFADASGWSDVFRSLSSRGYEVYAPANPLRGVASDGEYLRSFVSTLDGPVVLAGHSYGGCVITNASAGLSAVKALVYIAAYAPDEGETLSDAGTLGGGSTDLTKHLILRPTPVHPKATPMATSTQSISTSCSAPTSTPGSPGSWRTASAAWPFPGWSPRLACRAGELSPAGTWSRPLTRRSRPKLSARWPRGPAPTPWRSPAPTSP